MLATAAAPVRLRRFQVRAVMVALVLGSVGGLALGPVSASRPGADDLSHRILVGFDDAVPATVDALAVGWGGAVTFRNDVLLPYVAVDLRPGVDPEAALAAARATPGVRTAERDFAIQLLQFPAAVATPDPHRPWGVDAVRAPEAWAALDAANPAHTPALVAVVDTGTDCTAPDLVLACVLPSEDLIGHGTHVSGILAATRDNGIGVPGVSDARILSLKMFDDVLYPRDLDVLSGFKAAAEIVAAVAAHARVISMSWGSTTSSSLIQSAVQIADAAGVLLVAGAGNGHEKGEGVLYPAAYPEVIGVAAVDSSLDVASFSARGPEVELAAPGVDVLSTFPVGAYLLTFKYHVQPMQQQSCFEDETPLLAFYCSWRGTSMATPHVSAAAALVFEKCPFLTAADVRALLDTTAGDLGAVGRDDDTGYGLVDAFAAVDAAQCPDPLED